MCLHISLLISPLIAQIRIRNEQSRAAHRHRPLVHASSTTQVVYCGFAGLLSTRTFLWEAANGAKVLFLLAAVAATASLGEVIVLLCAVIVDHGCFFLLHVAHAVDGTNSWRRGAIAVRVGQIGAEVGLASSSTGEAASATAIADVVAGAGVFVAVISVVHFRCTQPHGYAGTCHQRGVVGAGLWCTVMSNLAPHSTHNTTAACARPHLGGVIVSSRNFRRCPHLGLSLSLQYPRIFMLRSVAPDCALLFPHERNV